MLEITAQTPCTAFCESGLIAAGELREVARRVKETLTLDPQASPLVFDDATGRMVELDLRGSVEEALARLPAGPATPGVEEAQPPRAGRPRLGVVAREVTLLPRHWEWLNSQPGGASVTLRKLVEEARRNSGGRDRMRASQEAAYRFMVALAGNRPGFEEATRALFAADRARFEELTQEWPGDLREYALKLARDAFQGSAG